MVDIGLVEKGDGGEITLNGNDLALVYSFENMPYLALFGGNLEASTDNTVTQIQSKDYWANNLIMFGDQSIQFNSETERTFNTTELTSAGRVIIENAIKKDLKFFEGMGIKVEVKCSIVSTDRLDVNIKLTSDDGTGKIIIIKYKKALDGDFSQIDFNDDFF